MKVSVSSIIVRGETQWVVSWTPPGAKRVRHYHTTKASAETEQVGIIAQYKQSGSVWMSLPAHERNTLINLFNEATRKGHTLRQAWDFFLGNQPLTRLNTAELLALLLDVDQHGCPLPQAVKFLRKAVDFYRDNEDIARSTVTTGEAYRQFVVELERQLVDGKSLKAYKSNVGRFVANHLDSPLISIKREDVMKWLTGSDWGPSTFNTYLTSLNSFFIWCMKTRKIKESPSATISKIRKERMPSFDKPPVILSLLQSARLLKSALELDAGLVPYIALGLFGGLRPEKEAGQLEAKEIQADRIHVRGSHAKDRQQRYLDIHPLLRTWLDIGGDIPPKNLRKRFELVREKAGLIKRIKEDGHQRLQIVSTGWAQDCLRHTFASHYRPIFGDDKTVKQLGHGDYSMLFGHYAQLVTPEEAAKYWMLTPEYIRQGKFEDLINLSGPVCTEPPPTVPASH